MVMMTMMMMLTMIVMTDDDEEAEEEMEGVEGRKVTFIPHGSVASSRRS